MATKYFADKRGIIIHHQHKYDYQGKAKAIGDSAVNQIEQMAADREYEVKKASRDEDMYDHFDYRFIKGEQVIKVEVKAMKRVSRSDSSGQETWIWVEFKNVQGEKGWLYGKADYVAFELEDAFLFVDRKDLVKVSEKVVDMDTIVKKPFDAKRKCYRRRNRPDELVAMLHITDILHKPGLKYKLWKKP